MQLTTFRSSLLAILIPTFMAACDIGVPDDAPVTVDLISTSASNVTGKAVFSQEGTKVKVVVTIAGATAGEHGMHLHDLADCSEPKGLSTGGHWNPDDKAHGMPGVSAYHLGDMGNVTIAADGTGTMTFVGPWTLGSGIKTDIIGRGIIFHAATDDGFTQTPPGNAGARQACGEIVR